MFKALLQVSFTVFEGCCNDFTKVLIQLLNKIFNGTSKCLRGGDQKRLILSHARAENITHRSAANRTVPSVVNNSLNQGENARPFRLDITFHDESGKMAHDFLILALHLANLHRSVRGKSKGLSSANIIEISGKKCVVVLRALWSVRITIGEP